ncbi:ABC transporter substrate-binding protein [Azospirillum canadense]|uniref:ABC transporter substrate-binding protein n=1 Tax=Azospirillum canadense TaxID=403962 RepID=UPI0022277333|nr:ABC transporter substrate-binding protein [Azospirillum canadense]MCW2241990.1 branched-chain amino acid transport system substrate-binding protein [Azospirillum canadense]
MTSTARKLLLGTALAAVGLVPFTADAKAYKVGLVASLSGPTASLGQQIERGARLYQSLHKDELGGDTVELIVRDDTGPAPDVAKRLAQELVVRDHVNFLAGIIFTPNANAIAPIATQAKVPFVIMNAASSATTKASPYIVRVSQTIAQFTSPLAKWAAQQKEIGTVYTLVSDYAPGQEAEEAFTAGFKGEGKKVVASVRVPVQSPDFVPFLQKVKDAKPDALYVFLPGGTQSTALLKAYQTLGLKEAGIRLIGSGEVTVEDELPNMGDAALGTVTGFHYSTAHKSPVNAEFMKAWQAAYGADSVPTFMAVGGYDGMAAIHHAIKTAKGNLTGDGAVEAMRHWNAESPRGPISIDPDTRDIVQNIYIRRVEKADGKLVNAEFETFQAVKDPGKSP